MAHAAQLEFVRLVSTGLADFFHDTRVLEIGSLDIAGSVRSVFKDCDYVGLDVAPGQGVDVVCQGQTYDAPDGSFDVVISCEVMEHNPHWAETFRNMIRLCRPGGLVVMTCATIGRPEHGTARTDPDSSPLTVALGWNYYKNLRPGDFKGAADISSSFSSHRFWINWNHFDLLFVGIRKSSSQENDSDEAFERTDREVGAWLDKVSGGRVHAYRAFVAKVFGDRWFRSMQRTGEVLSWLHNIR